MKFALAYANTGFGSSAAGALALATAAEAAGFESLWTVEHVIVPSGYASAYPYDPSGKMAGGMEDFDLPDPLIWMAYVAAATSTIRLATGILIVPQRNPVVTAKAVATLDHLSGGRVELGVGVGWLEEEFRALGVPFADRGRRLDDYIAAMRALWTQDKASISTKYAEFAGCISRPRPAQGSVPIVIGGHSDAAARRAGRLGDGFFPMSASAEELERLLGVMRAAAESAGRDAGAIDVTTGALGGARDLDALARTVERFDALGVRRVVVSPTRPEHLGAFGDSLRERFDMESPTPA